MRDQDPRDRRPDGATDPMTANGWPFLPLDRWWQDPKNGTAIYSEEYRRAVIDRWVREAAVATRDGLLGPGPHRPPLVDGLRHMHESTVAARLKPVVGQRAEAVAALRLAEQQTAQAGAEVEEAEAAVAASNAAKPSEPATGRRLTHPAVLLAVVPIFAYLEMKLTSPGLRAALGTTDKVANLVGAAIAFISLIVAEFMGLGLAGAVHNRRRAAKAVIIALTLATMAMVTVGVFELATSREQNIEYRDKLNAEASTNTTGAGFHNTTAATPAEAKPAELAPPALGFIAPLTLAAMLAAAGLAMRVSLAAPIKRWENDHPLTVSAIAESRNRLDEFQNDQAAAIARLDANDLEIGAVVEIENGIHNGLIARLSGEYPRACAAIGTRPVALVVDEVDNQDPRPIHHRLIDPDRATSTQPVVVPTHVEPPAGAPPAGAVPAPEPVAPAPEPSPPAPEPVMPIPQAPAMPSPTPAPARDPAPPAPEQEPVELTPEPAPQERELEPVAPVPEPAPQEPEPPAPADPPHPTNNPTPGPPPRGSWIRNGRPPGWQS